MQNSFHHVLMMTHLSFHKRIMAEAKKLGLTSGQPKILEFLSENEGVEQKTIAEHCEIERASAGSILGRMESAGLIERRREGGNRRYTYTSPLREKRPPQMSSGFLPTQKSWLLRDLMKRKLKSCFPRLKKYTKIQTQIFNFYIIGGQYEGRKFFSDGRERTAA